MINSTNFFLVFYLVISIKNIIQLLSLNEACATATALAVVGTCLLTGNVLVTRFQNYKQLERILKTEAAQRAIAYLAQKPGFDQCQSEKHIRALCADNSIEDAEVMLMAIACLGSGEGFIEISDNE